MPKNTSRSIYMNESYIATIISLAICVGTYLWGRNDAIEPVTDKVLTMLESQGFIKIKINPKTGEKELQKVKCI